MRTRTKQISLSEVMVFYVAFMFLLTKPLKKRYWRRHIDIHSGNTKIYRNLHEHYWCNDMKREVVQFVSRCSTFNELKVNINRPAAMLQPVPIPEWKWEYISMDFVVGLLSSKRAT